MDNRNETVENVVEFAQSESNAKQFRHDHPVTDELRDTLLTEVYRDFTKYVLEQSYAANHLILKEFVDEYDPGEEKSRALEHNLFWWQMLYYASQNSEVSWVDSYISEHYQMLHNKPLITSWLKEWEKATPKFYYVGYKHNNRVFVIVDILTTETLDVIVYDPQAVPPQKGEIIMGTLIPLGDALYFPIIDFYHFDFKARNDIASYLNQYYDNHSETTTILEEFIHVLSATLQLERLIDAKE